MALSMTPFCLSGQDEWNKVKHYFIVIAMPVLVIHDNDDIINKMAASLVQDDWNDIQHDLFSHLTLLVLASASCDAKGIVNSTIVFIKLRWLKQCLI